jgi:hypothetical protein
MLFRLSTREQTSEMLRSCSTVAPAASSSLPRFDAQGA